MNNRRENIYELEKTRSELSKKSMDALKKGDFARSNEYMRQVCQIKERIDRLNEEMEFLAAGDKMDKHKQSAMGNVFYLSIASADMCIFLLDMYFAFIKERGNIPVDEWQSVRKDMIYVISKFRKYMTGFICSRSGMGVTHFSMNELMNIVRDRMFTDRERVFFDEFYDKSANL